MLAAACLLVILQFAVSLRDRKPLPSPKTEYVCRLPRMIFCVVFSYQLKIEDITLCLVQFFRFCEGWLNEGVGGITNMISD